MQNRPYTKRELDTIAKERCRKYRNRVKNNRVYCPEEEIKSTKDDSWDMPLVVAACSSERNPYEVKTGRNNSTLRNCNTVLKTAYEKNGVRIGEKPPHPVRLYPGEDYFEAGHCAEPHAAHALLNVMKRHGVTLKIGEIDFSSAYNCKNNTVHDYCGTCKLVFPQLR